MNKLFYINVETNKGLIKFAIISESITDAIVNVEKYGKFISVESGPFELSKDWQ